ncbi:MAG: DUF4173 domain-containing protein [Solirubrobacteraceae bacterium]|nr:DUF4173 domain-containing protein [Solirubrobacteraceae bacterium]
MRRVGVATLLVVLVAAFGVAGAPMGLALALTGLGVIGVLLVLWRGRASWDRWLLVACAVLLALAPLLRDAGWVVAFDLVVAWLCVVVAAVRGTSVPAVVLAPLVALRELPAGLALAGRDIGALLPRHAPSRFGPALRGGALAATLLAVFGALFVSADGAFAQLAESALPEPPDIGILPVRVLLAVAFAAIIGSLVRTAHWQPADTERAAGRQLGPIEWVPALGGLVLLFGAFVAVQIVVLFGGRGHVLDTAGLTYAEYAHQGFGQLVVVTALVLGVLVAASRWTAAPGGSEPVRRVLLLVLCALTLVIVASALHRLDVYVDAFGATRLRVQAATLCALLGGVVALAAVGVAIRRGGWLPRAVVVLMGLTAIAVTIADPDRRIAERNIDRWERTGNVDAWYLDQLSADAAPTLAAAPRALRNEIGVDCPPADDGLAGFNLARDQARSALRC